MLTNLKQVFDEEGWYCVLSDKENSNQIPDLNNDFEIGFDYEDFIALSVIDIENRIVINVYFYIVNAGTFYLLGDKGLSDKPLVYRKGKYNISELISDIKELLTNID